MRQHDQELIAILAAICLASSSGSPSRAIDNAEAILRLVKERYPLTITGDRFDE